MQQVTDRRYAIFRAFEPGDIGLRRIVHRFDRAFCDGGANQHASDRLGHGLRNQPVAIDPAILIILTKNLVVLGDQQAGDGIARQIVRYGRATTPVVIANFRLRPFERPWYSSALDAMRWIDFVEMAVGADTILRLVWLAGLNRQRAIGNRKPRRGAVMLGVRAGK